MSIRPVYQKNLKKPFYKTQNFDLDFKTGQAPTVKTRNSIMLQDAYKARFPGSKTLEVSTKSDTDLGARFSPFNLEKKLPFLKKAFPVENIYHAAKVFEKGGPYVDLLGTSPQEALKDPRLKSSGNLLHFRLDKSAYPASPDILFYNFLYLMALKENPALFRQLQDYDAFCDIEFNPKTGSNNQARACAIAASLMELGLADQIKSFEDFKNLFLVTDITEIKEPMPKDVKQESFVPEEAKRSTSFKVGDWVFHPAIGRGEVVKKNEASYVIRFPIAGPKTIAKDYAEEKCTLIR